MASIYQRPDSQKYQLTCYPRPGAKLLRASLDTKNELEAKKVAHAVELLIELEKLGEIQIPKKLMAELPGVRSLLGGGLGSVPNSESRDEIPKQLETPKCAIDDAIRYLIKRSFNGENAHHATLDKISRFRQFFGPDRINTLDPRSEEDLARRRKVKEPLRWCKKKDINDKEEEATYYRGNEMSEITPEVILEFLKAKKYGSSSKRHYRELFHELFKLALRNGSYVPSNPYAANPADDLPSYDGKDGPVIVLSHEDEVELYAAVANDTANTFGCQLMIEAGFRLHEILALQRCDLRLSEGIICLRMPERERVNSTGLKTGERTVTMRKPMQRMIEVYLDKHPGRASDWCFKGKQDNRMTSDEFGKQLRNLNKKAGIPWTTQDFRHTFATNRIKDGWNLKVLAQEMGTSLVMLEEHYAGYIKPPVSASLQSPQ